MTRWLAPHPVSPINPYLLSKKRYRVTATMVAARLLTGRRQQFHRGDLLPVDLHPRHAADMLRKGLIEEVAA